MNKRRLFLGAALIVLGILGPTLLPIHLFGIIPDLYRAIETAHQGLLILVAAKLVLINTLRGVPHYLGTFLVADELYVLGGRYGSLFSAAAPLIILPFVYHSIWLLHGVTYDLGTPAVVTIVGMLLLSAMRRDVPGIMNRALIVLLVLFGVQWLDVMPAFDSFRSGRGEISHEIKAVADFLGSQEVLNFLGCTFLVVILTMAFLLVQLLVAHHREIERERLDRERERELERMRIAALEAKSLREIQSLVHDLKTPLTAIQGLSSVLELTWAAGERGTDLGAVFARMNKAIDAMNNMVSDLLVEKRRQPLEVEELLKYVIAQVSTQQGACTIELKVEPGLPRVAGNRIRLARALANLLENSLQAVPQGEGRITIRALSKPGGGVRISITDNGSGLGEPDQDRVFAPGFSTKGSTGLGLPFAREVIETHGGYLTLSCNAGKGTTAIVDLPGVKESAGAHSGD